MSREPVEARLAATLMLGRDGPGGIEVFMVVRHHRIDFATGALVFPGGKVEDADRDPRLRTRCRGGDALSDAALAIRTACVREAFEEAGVLLAASGAVRISSAPSGWRRSASAGASRWSRTAPPWPRWRRPRTWNSRPTHSPALRTG